MESKKHIEQIKEAIQAFTALKDFILNNKVYESMRLNSSMSFSGIPVDEFKEVCKELNIGYIIPLYCFDQPDKWYISNYVVLDEKVGVTAGKDIHITIISSHIDNKEYHNYLLEQAPL